MKQDWYKSNYFKTYLENVLFENRRKITDEEKELLDLSIRDTILNFAAAVQQLSKTMKLFLDFTAKAADVQILNSLLRLVSEFAEVSEVILLYAEFALVDIF